MTSITLNVTGAKAQASVNGPLTSGMVGIPVTIRCNDVWNGLTKNLVCRCAQQGPDRGVTRTVMSVDDTATVAHEVMKAGMYLFLGVEGYRADGTLVIPTTWAYCGKIEHGADGGADPSAIPTLPVWAQLEAKIGKLQENAVTDERIAAVVAAYLEENPAGGSDSSEKVNQSQLITAVEAVVAEEMAKRGQLQPEYANSVEDCTDISKLYVLPDGYIYAYLTSGEPVQTNLFSFDNADEIISKISGSTDTAIYDTKSSYGYKDTTNNQFISKVNSSGGRYAITGGLPAALPAGTYKASAEVYIPSGSENLRYRFGVCRIPSKLSDFGSFTASANDLWEPVEYTFTIPEGDRYTYIAVMSEASDFEIRWRNIQVVDTADEGTVQAQWTNTGVMFVQSVRKWQGKKWAVMGDSLTDVGAYTHKHYFTYIAEATGITTVNMGNSASGFKREFDIGTAYYQRILDVPTDTDVVTIMASGNDLSAIWNTYGLGEVTDTGTDTICGCINTTIDNLFSVLPLVRVGIITPTPWDSFYPSATEDPQNRMTLYSEAIVEICKRRGIPCLDLYHCSGLRPWEAEYRNLVYSNDNGGGVHPNEIGNEMMATRIKAFLETLML